MNSHKNTALALVTGILFGGHLFLLAPLTIYFANHNEFSIELSQILLYLLTASAVSSVFVFALILVLHKKGYVRLVAFVMGLGLYLYIQFYYLVWNYGIFDGREINWNQNALPGVFELFGIALIAVISLYFSRRFISPALILLSVLFIGECLISAEGYRNYRDLVEATPDAEDPTLDSVLELSTERNVIILLVDTLQSDVFEELLNENPELKRNFSGFTYFRNSTGSFPWTHLSTQAILTGAHYQPGEKLEDYYTRVRDQYVHRIIARNGGLSAYIDITNNVEYLEGSSQANHHQVAKLFDVVVFRQVPHFIKPLIFNDHAFRLRRIFSESTLEQRDLDVLRSLSSESFVGTNPLTFKFLHFWGAHPPAALDENCQPRDVPLHSRKGITAQASCVLRSLTDYLDALRDLDVYDKSFIFLVADHGSHFPIGSESGLSNEGSVPDFVMSTGHPAIAVKDFDDVAGFRVSNAPVALTDIAATILDRMDFANAQSGRDLFSVPEDELRSRKFLYFESSNEAYGEKIAFMHSFGILGFTRDQASWKLESVYTDIAEVTKFIDFGSPDSTGFLDLAWSRFNGRSTTSWSLQPKASILAKLPDQRSVELRIRMRSFIEGQKVHVHLNGRPITTWDVPANMTLREYLAILDLSADERAQVNKIEFLIEKSRQPNEKDPRKLGISVDWVKFE